MAKAVRAIHLLSVLILCVFAVVDFLDLAQFAVDPRSFVFGYEGAGFSRQSVAHFLGTLGVRLALVLVALFLSFSRLPRQLVIGIQVLLAEALTVSLLTWWTCVLYGFCC